MINKFNPDPSFSFDEENHIYKLRGGVIPSVTQVYSKRFPFYNNGDPVPAAKGSYIHKCISLYLRGELDRSKLLYDTENYIDSFDSFICQSGYKMQKFISEVSMYHSFFEYGFTTDVFFTESGDLIDVKTGSYFNREQFEMQLIAYAEGLRSWGFKVNKMITVRLYGKDKKYGHKPVEFLYDKNIYREFIALKKQIA